MRDSKNITIALLCITASLLTTAVLVINHAQPALAVTSESRAGDYVMVCGSISDVQDILYVVDTAAQRMNGYAVNRNSRAVELIPGCAVDLAAAFQTEQNNPRGGRKPPDRTLRT